MARNKLPWLHENLLFSCKGYRSEFPPASKVPKRFPLPLFFDGVAKSPISCVVAGPANARRPLRTPERGRHHHASASHFDPYLYIELLCLAAIGSVFLSFYGFISVAGPGKSSKESCRIVCHAIPYDGV
jgi:hypothetical protein